MTEYNLHTQDDYDRLNHSGVTFADEVASPTHYTWIGQAIVSSGGPERTEDIESWDILDALFPDDPHLWNAGKYLTRLGRKGPGVRRIVDLRKARTYLDRAIRREERDA